MTRKELLARARWFPSVGPVSAQRSKAPADPLLSDVPLATNGDVASILPAAERATLRTINTSLTQLAIEQCCAGGGAANIVEYGSKTCVALAEFAAHDVFPDDLLTLSREHDVVFPWSLQYGNARTPFNFRLVKLPLIIAYPRTVDEVVFWVNFVRDYEFTVSIRSGGNSYEGLSSSNQVILDLTYLALQKPGDGTQILVGPGKEFIDVTPGVRLGVLYAELAKYDLMLAGGQCAPVCVGGLVGTGGVGYSTRQFGFVCDQLIEVEVALANGSVVVANATNEYADLYRAAKGAGAAGLGVMTRFRMKVKPAKRVLFYAIAFSLPSDDGGALGARVTAAWQNLVTAPDPLSSIVAAFSRTEALGAVLTFNGEYRIEDDKCSIEEATRELREKVLGCLWLDPLKKSSGIEPDLFEIIDLDPKDGETSPGTVVASLVPMPIYNQWKIKSRFTFRPMTVEELAPVFEYLEKRTPSNDVSKAVGYFNPMLMGGESNRIDPESAVVPARAGSVWWIHAGAQWNDPSLETSGLDWVRGLWDILGKALHADPDTHFYNCPELELGSQLAEEPKLDYVKAYWRGRDPKHDFVPFLVGVKKKYDPTDVFKFAQSIPVEVPA
jgi:hypothetical protein